MANKALTAWKARRKGVWQGDRRVFRVKGTTVVIQRNDPTAKGKLGFLGRSYAPAGGFGGSHIEVYLPPTIKSSSPAVKAAIRHELGHAEANATRRGGSSDKWTNEVAAWKYGIRAARGHLHLPTMRRALQSYHAHAKPERRRKDIARLVAYATVKKSGWAAWRAKQRQQKGTTR